MHSTIFGKKLGMGEVYLGETRYGATKIELYPMQVAAHKTKERDGYNALQLAFGVSSKKHNKALSGHLKNSSANAKFLREVKSEELLELGSTIAPGDVVQVGSVADVTGTSKGKGLAGVVKLHNFAGGPRTHGQSDRLRRAGSIGQGTTPGRVYKGKKMAGRMGGNAVTMKGATIVSFDPTTNIAWVTGPVPGHTGSLIELNVTHKREIESVKL